MNRSLSLLGAVGLAAFVAASAAVVPAGATPVVAPASPAAQPGRYVALTPQRALDTRVAGGAFGQGERRSLDLSGAIPSTAVAVVLNLTATDPTQPGYLTVWPSGQAQPLASSLNKQAGETRSNSVTVALPGGTGPRSVDIFNQAGSTQVVVDVLGYYDTANGSSYYPFSQPQRAFDSRDPGEGRFGPGDSVTITGNPDLTGVTAVAVNITAVDPDGPGYLTAWNSQGGQPFVSSVNYSPGRVTPNFAVVPAFESGGVSQFTVGNNVSDTDVVIDVVGVYATTGQEAYSTSYVPTAPIRLSDTRQTGALGPNQVYDTTVPGGADYYAANLNVTAVEPTAGTFLTVYASDVDKPFVSNLNAAPGDVVPNAVQTLLSVPGQYRVYNASGYLNVVADLEGVFVGDSAGKASAARSLPSTRFSATRH